MMTLQVNENIQAAIQKGTWARFLVNNIIFKDTDFITVLANNIVRDSNHISGYNHISQNAVRFDCTGIHNIDITEIYNNFNKYIYNLLNSSEVNAYLSTLMNNEDKVDECISVTKIAQDPLIIPMLYSLEFIQDKYIILYF